MKGRLVAHPSPHTTDILPGLSKVVISYQSPGTCLLCNIIIPVGFRSEWSFLTIPVPPSWSSPVPKLVYSVTSLSDPVNLLAPEIVSLKFNLLRVHGLVSAVRNKLASVEKPRDWVIAIQNKPRKWSADHLNRQESRNTLSHWDCYSG